MVFVHSRKDTVKTAQKLVIFVNLLIELLLCELTSMHIHAIHTSLYVIFDRLILLEDMKISRSLTMIHIPSFP